MLLRELLKPDQVSYCPELNSKKQVLQHISMLFSEHMPWIKSKDIFQCLLERERISSTAIGHGVAIPHCRSEEVKEPIGCLLTLKDSIDFNSVDNKPVNIIFALMVPEENYQEHLNLLAKIAELLDKPEIREKLSTASSTEDLFELINNY
jgi:PTS system nitrogen regulatory IIA component